MIYAFVQGLYCSCCPFPAAWTYIFTQIFKIDGEPRSCLRIMNVIKCIIVVRMTSDNQPCVTIHWEIRREFDTLNYGWTASQSLFKFQLTHGRFVYPMWATTMSKLKLTTVCKKSNWLKLIEYCNTEVEVGSCVIAFCFTYRTLGLVYWDLFVHYKN